MTSLLPLILIILPQPVVGAAFNLILGELSLLFGKRKFPTNPLAFINEFSIFVIVPLLSLGVGAYKAGVAR